MTSSVTWTNPLTGSDVLPDTPGDILSAVVAYWEDVLFEARSRRPRKTADREQKIATIERACERLSRYRGARDVLASSPKLVNKLTIKLATDDLAAVMRASDVTQERAA